MSLLIAILGLALLIFVHEAGHFFAARLVGMSPSRFYIGFPPALAKVQRRGIEYGIGAIPRGGDVILGINGRSLTPEEIRTTIADSKGKPLTLRVRRNGEVRLLGPVRPAKEGGVYRLGFALRGARLEPPAALWRSVRLTGLVTKQIGVSLGNLVHGKGRKDIASPVGIVQGSSTALTESVQSYLWVLGLISLSLALLNLLPLLPLDGGHIAFSVVEGLRGRSVGREVYERVS